MARFRPEPKNVEKVVPSDKFLVSKTDTKGIITYANPIFVEISGYTEDELVGANHNIVRHPDMPRTVFRILWQTIQQGEEVFAFVKNLSKDGSFYWVFAHVTPTFDTTGKIVGYQSDRRPVRKREVLSTVIEPLYAKLREIESSQGIDTAVNYLNSLIKEKEMTEYNQLILSLY
ncbi:MAG: PAS domain-containing protein [Hydrogenothermaceae bacterium]